MNLNVHMHSDSLLGYLLLKECWFIQMFCVCFCIRDVGGDCSSPHRHYCRGGLAMKRMFLKRRQHRYGLQRLLKKKKKCVRGLTRDSRSFRAGCIGIHIPPDSSPIPFSPFMKVMEPMTGLKPRNGPLWRTEILSSSDNDQSRIWNGKKNRKELWKVLNIIMNITMSLRCSKGGKPI